MMSRVAIALGLTVVLGACASEPPPPRTDAAFERLPATTLHVIVRGLHNVDGQVRLVLFAGPDGFPGEPEKGVREMEAAIEADTVAFAIEDVPAGYYALSVLHDENADGEMETGMFGRPQEGYGFSQDARGRFGPPSFADAMFAVRGEPLTVDINLTYP